MVVEEEELAHHRKRACRSSKHREAARTRSARPKALGKTGFVHISLHNFEYRLGAGIIGSAKNLSNLM